MYPLSVRVGMVGLGNNGGHVATNLVVDGHEVTVFDADASRSAAVDGATPATSVHDLAPDCAVTIMSLPTPAVVDAVAAEWAAAAHPGSVLVDLSTNSPDAVRRLGERLDGTGHHLVEAPLTGGAIGAERRLLMFMVGGTEDAVAAARPVLEPLGRAFFHLGPLGVGNTMKLVNSLIAYTATWSSLEGLSLASKAGIEVQQAVEVLRTGGAGNFFLDRMVEGIDQRGRPTQFALELAAKDARLVVETGESLGVPTPTASAIAGILAGAVELGLGGADWSELVTVAEQLGDVRLRWDPDTL
jgi:3-hydroxyisobutyrate dehydrogenase-like beta-hydroxyacid dehydrogenase